MHLYVYSGRHVVASEVEKGEEGTLKVVRVGLVDDVSGAKRRGRHPDFSQPVPVAKLVELENPTDELLAKAESLLSGTTEAAEAPAAESGDDSDD